MAVMALRLTLLPALLAPLLTSTACSSRSAPEGGSMPVASRQWSEQVHRKLNDYRRSRDLSPLEHHEGLRQLAADHSNWMRRKRGSFFLHGSNVSHSGSLVRARTSRILHGMEAWGENVAYISDTPEDVARHLIVMWKSSPPHHRAMLDNWTHAGTAISVDADGAIFATMNFGRKK